MKATHTAERAMEVGLPQVSCAPEEWNTRIELAACYRLLARFGLSDLTSTHVSALVPGSEKHLLLNPFGLLFEEITASNLVKCDYDGRVIGDTQYIPHPAGVAVHGAVHRARPDAFCVAHSHGRAGVAVGALKCGLLPLSQTSLIFYGRVGYTDYSWAEEEAACRQLAADLDEKCALLMRNHGLLTVGRTVGEAFILMYRLNLACQIQVETLSMGREIVLPPDDVCRKAAEGWWEGEPIMGQRSWDALFRELERTDASFRS